MYSAYKLNKQGDNIQPWRTPFLIWNQSVVPLLALTVASWLAYRFLKRQVRWSGIPISWRLFLFVVIHTVKGLGIVNKAEVDVFLELSYFFDDLTDVGNFISGSLAFSKSSLNIWKFTVNVLLKPGLENFENYLTSVWDECNCVVVWAFFDIAFLWDWNENWPFPVLWPLLSFPNLLDVTTFFIKGLLLFPKSYAFSFLIFIYLAAQGLSCGIRILSCCTWDLLPWLGIKPGSPTLWPWSLSHWTTREVPYVFLYAFQILGILSDLWLAFLF